MTDYINEKAKEAALDYATCQGNIDTDTGAVLGALDAAAPYIAAEVMRTLVPEVGHTCEPDVPQTTRVCRGCWLADWADQEEAEAGWPIRGEA